MWMGRWVVQNIKLQTSNFKETPSSKFQADMASMESKEISMELLEKPVCGADELGKPIPDSTHAVSVALPRWADVVGYEEKKSEVINRLQSGYPRFLIHPLVLELSRRFGKGQ